MPPNILREKKLIAKAVEYVVDKMKGVSLVRTLATGISYPYSLDVPGVGVFGPDGEGHYTVSVSISVAAMRIPEAADKLRSEIWNEFQARGLADRIESIDISVEDLMMAV